MPTEATFQTQTSLGISLNSGFIQSPEDLLHFGLKETGTRHNATFKICVYLKLKEKSVDEAFEILKNWSLEQKERGMCKSSVQEIIFDIRSIVRFIYSPRFHLPAIQNQNPITISKEDYQFLNSVKSNSRNAKRVLLALLINAKLRSTDDGIFSMSNQQIQKITEANEEYRDQNRQQNELYEHLKAYLPAENKDKKPHDILRECIDNNIFIVSLGVQSGYRQGFSEGIKLILSALMLDN